jgi:elongator complex protein 3
MDIFASLHTEADIAKLKKHIARTASLRAELLRVREGALYTKGGKRKTTEFSVPSTAELRQLYTMYVREGRISSSPRVEDLLKKMRTKSNSGVAVVSVLTMPYRCPGRCTYCPFDARMPKSYLSDEPAAARALATDFDPYIQVHTRLRALVANGHPVD